MRYILSGILFAALWASASAATKYGIQSVDPLILANVRFFIAGLAMLLFAYAFNPSANALPVGKEWRQLTIFALLNTTIYLGAFVLAMQQVSAGIGSLSTATNPLFITVLSAFWLKRRLLWFEVVGLLLGLAGVLIATYPLLQNSYASLNGLLILLAGMLSVSAATVYYTSIKWRLSNIVINGWQVLIGGLLLLPFTILFSNFSAANTDARFWGAVFWLVLPVSIIGLQLWFYLIKVDAIRASLWIFLCPPFGFVYAYFLFNEPITLFTYAGTGLVIGGLYLAQRSKLQKA